MGRKALFSLQLFLILVVIGGAATSANVEEVEALARFSPTSSTFATVLRALGDD
jgi:hypothetical protein